MSRSAVCLRIIIIGAGMGGLSAAIACALAGHSVLVLESAPELGEVGAGLQITPNGTRILKSWKLDESFWQSAAEPTQATMHRYADGKVLAVEDNWHLKMHQQYGAPLLDMHRGDLQRALLTRAKELGVEFGLGKTLVSVDSNGPVVTVASGEQFRCDLVVGADGLWSKCRECFLGQQDKPQPTGDLAYRIMLRVEDIPDADLRDIVLNPCMNIWIGPDSHVIAYTVRSGKLYNIVLLRPDDLPAEVAKQPGSIEEMRAIFSSWDPILQRFLNLVTKVEKWKLMHRPEMDSWINENGNFVLLGDACHPMLPYLAQGVNSSIEDGSVLGLLLGRISSKDQLPQALKMYQDLRKARGERIVQAAAKQRDINHMHDGPEQQARDARFAADNITWPPPDVRKWLFSYDATQEVEQALARKPLARM